MRESGVSAERMARRLSPNPRSGANDDHRALVVDASRTAASGCAASGSGEGAASVEEVVDGGEALELLAKTAAGPAADVILLDRNMPGCPATPASAS